MGLFEPQHLIIILVIALLIFGPGKIADLGGSLGRAVRDFKQSMAEAENTTAQATQAPAARPAALQSQPEAAPTVVEHAEVVKESA